MFSSVKKKKKSIFGWICSSIERESKGMNVVLLLPEGTYGWKWNYSFQHEEKKQKVKHIHVYLLLWYLTLVT